MTGSPESKSNTQCSPWLLARGKRLLDLVIALPALIVAGPVIVVGAIGIRLTSPGSLFFRHPRAGLDGQVFVVLKLRTMHEISPKDESSAVSDAQRLTRFGSFLRRYSLDELPQLINVVRGEMSIVGPRPLPLHYISSYTDTQRRRLLTRPGITGLSQVVTRNASDWPHKLALDVEYIDQARLSLDLCIIFKTFRAVITGSGVAAPGHATMPEFKATPPETDQ